MDYQRNLRSIKDCDHIHNKFVKEKNEEKKKDLFQTYKTKRNLIKILIRQSKRDYYLNYFEEYKSDIKKT